VSSSIDYTNEMTPIKNQGNLGSCVGFAVCSLKEWQEVKEKKEKYIKGENKIKQTIFRDLSEQWLYYKCKEIDPWPNEEGTSIRCAMKILQENGVPIENAWPYNDSVVGSPQKWSTITSTWCKIKNYKRVNTKEELKQALINEGPVVAGILCFMDIFYVNSNGIVPDPINDKEYIGGHAICIVGYNDATQRFKFKNSWSEKWGEKGYGYLSYNYIDKYAMDMWSTTDLVITKEDVIDNFRKNRKNKI